MEGRISERFCKANETLCIKLVFYDNLFIASVLLVLTLVIGACSQRVQSEQKGLPALKVSENQRFLVDEKGNPFFWQGKRC